MKWNEQGNEQGIDGMRPIAITIIPVTEVVAWALASGLLERRLALGLEEIYVSEHAIVVMPSLERPLRDLACRYRSLVLVPRGTYTRFYLSIRPDPLGLKTETAREYMYVGGHLTTEYEDHYERIPDEMPEYRWRIGVFPKETGFAGLHELIVEPQDWPNLDIQDMARRVAEGQAQRLIQRAQSRAALRDVLKGRK